MVKKTKAMSKPASAMRRWLKWFLMLGFLRTARENGDKEEFSKLLKINLDVEQDDDDDEEEEADIIPPVPVLQMNLDVFRDIHGHNSSDAQDLKPERILKTGLVIQIYLFVRHISTGLHNNSIVRVERAELVGRPIESDVLHRPGPLVVVHLGQLLQVEKDSGKDVGPGIGAPLLSNLSFGEHREAHY